MPLAEDQHPVGDLGSGGEHESFRIGIRARAAGRDLRGLDTGAGQDCVECPGELPCPVTDQEPEIPGMIAGIHQEIADLLGGPRPVRVRGHSRDMHIPGADLDHEQAVQALKGHRHVVSVRRLGAGGIVSALRTRRIVDALTRWPTLSSSCSHRHAHPERGRCPVPPGGPGSRRKVAGQPMRGPQIVKSEPVFQVTEDAQGRLVGPDRAGIVAGQSAHGPQGVVGLAEPVAEVAVDDQRLLQRLVRARIVAGQPTHGPQVVEGPGPRRYVAVSYGQSAVQVKTTNTAGYVAMQAGDLSDTYLCASSTAPVIVAGFNGVVRGMAGVEGEAGRREAMAASVAWGSRKRSTDGDQVLARRRGWT